MLREALEPFDLKRMVEGKSVFLKPNFVRPDYKFNPANSTDPRMILLAGKLLLEAGATRVVVGDNPGKGLSLKEALENVPFADRWTDYGIETFHYEDSDPVEIELPEAVLFRKMKIPTGLKDFDVFINLAKIKMHMMVTASLGIKNLYGLLYDEQRMSFHRNDVSIKLVEMLKVFPPDLTILDGIWALEGQAPICGEPVRDFNTIVVGRNPVAVDSVGSEIIGIAPHELSTNRIAHSTGMGPIDLNEIEILGTPVDKVKRHLKRSVISSMGAYPNCVVYELGACLGIMNSMRHALDRLHYSGELEHIPRNTFILGTPGPYYEPLTQWDGDLWLIGDEIQSAYDDGADIYRIPGSPPHFGEIMKMLKKKYLK